MITHIDAMRDELLREAQSTKRLLERVPGDRLGWKPHKKSMTLGQLALHVAEIPGNLSQMDQTDEFDTANADFEPPAPESAGQIMAAFNQSLKVAENYLTELDVEKAESPWRLTLRGNEVFKVQRLEMLRGLMRNHWYHHRGQLTVYRRLLDVPLPVVYGRTTDENPFV